MRFGTHFLWLTRASGKISLLTKRSRGIFLFTKQNKGCKTRCKIKFCLWEDVKLKKSRFWKDVAKWDAQYMWKKVKLPLKAYSRNKIEIRFYMISLDRRLGNHGRASVFNKLHTLLHNKHCCNGKQVPHSHHWHEYCVL